MLFKNMKQSTLDLPFPIQQRNLLIVTLIKFTYIFFYLPKLPGS